jgi:bifunctional non-homologous end joining protein LigD
VSKLSATTAILDGEVVVLDRHEISDFQALQNALGEDRHQTALMYFVFDILYLDGFDLTNVPLLARKTLLKQLLHRPNTASPSIRYSEHIFGDAARIAARACSAGLEGIVSKRVAAPYRSGRGTDWVKSKCRQGQEFVIGGYTQPTGSREGFGALLVGYYRSDGKLVYAGKVGTGFTRQTLRSLLTQMRPFGRSRTPFADLGQKTGLRGIHWIEPRLVAQVEFNNWTQDGLLRQAAFLGLRNDKSPQAVTRERAANVSRIRH